MHIAYIAICRRMIIWTVLIFARWMEVELVARLASLCDTPLVCGELFFRGLTHVDIEPLAILVYRDIARIGLGRETKPRWVVYLRWLAGSGQRLRCSGCSE